MSEDESVNLPFVSVIVPVFNDPEGIQNCIRGLIGQTYPHSRYEVLVVDNGSTDRTREVIRDFSVQLLTENEIQGSYAARNKGIANATGEIFAFLDADCKPESNWIEAGVSTLLREGADLVAGRVRFTFSSERTAAERFDALVHMRNDKHVTDGVGKTANLFARKTVVDEIGLFPQHLKSGGDVYWTKAATDAGITLVYAADSTVSHPSRRLHPLLKKMYRVGKGSAEMWQLDEETTPWTVLAGLLSYPVKVFRFLRSEEANDRCDSTGTPPDRDIEMTIGVYLVGALGMSLLAVGRIVALIKSVV